MPPFSTPSAFEPSRGALGPLTLCGISGGRSHRTAYAELGPCRRDRLAVDIKHTLAMPSRMFSSRVFALKRTIIRWKASSASCTRGSTRTRGFIDVPNLADALGQIFCRCSFRQDSRQTLKDLSFLRNGLNCLGLLPDRFLPQSLLAHRFLK